VSARRPRHPCNERYRSLNADTVRDELDLAESTRQRVRSIVPISFPEASSAARTWKVRWEAVSDGMGGGQSDTKIVVDRTGALAGKHFLKILRSQNDPVRRRRMFREVTAYQTLKHRGIPQLVDTNADCYEDIEHKLYLVTEFIQGQTLEERIGAGVLGFEDAVALVMTLLETVRYCHGETVLHRDIKPDNVMLRSGSISDPVLVDFGLSFNKTDPSAMETLPDEEVGNRFLRLPEFNPGSVNKRSDVSDVTLCCGILQYALTGLIPGGLSTGFAQRPHQRDDIRRALETNVPEAKRHNLLRIFDQGFRDDPEHRWQSASQLSEALQNLLRADREEALSIDEMVQAIEREVQTPHTRSTTALVHRRETLKSSALSLAQQTVLQIGHGTVQLVQSGAEGNRPFDTRLAIQRKDLPQQAERWLHIRNEVEGDEIVLSGTPIDDSSVEAVARFRFSVADEDNHKLRSFLTALLVPEIYQQLKGVNLDLQRRTTIESLEPFDEKVLVLSCQHALERGTDSFEASEITAKDDTVNGARLSESLDVLEKEDISRPLGSREPPTTAPARKDLKPTPGLI